jgi:hypothetical protein
MSNDELKVPFDVLFGMKLSWFARWLPFLNLRLFGIADLEVWRICLTSDCSALHTFVLELRCTGSTIIIPLAFASILSSK